MAPEPSARAIVEEPRMRRIRSWHRYVLGLTLIGLGGFWVFGPPGEHHPRSLMAQAAELKVPDDAAVERFDFELSSLEGWKTVDGQWTVEELSGAPSGQRVLVQRAVKNAFDVIVAPGGQAAGAEVSLLFEALPG